MQLFLTITTILIALLYLGMNFYKRFFGKEKKCDGCSLNKELEKNEF